MRLPVGFRTLGLDDAVQMNGERLAEQSFRCAHKRFIDQHVPFSRPAEPPLQRAKVISYPKVDLHGRMASNDREGRARPAKRDSQLVNALGPCGTR